jgi:hypothetical protein
MHAGAPQSFYMHRTYEPRTDDNRRESLFAQSHRRLPLAGTLLSKKPTDKTSSAGVLGEVSK